MKFRLEMIDMHGNGSTKWPANSSLPLKGYLNFIVWSPLLEVMSGIPLLWRTTDVLHSEWFKKSGWRMSVVILLFLQNAAGSKLIPVHCGRWLNEVRNLWRWKWLESILRVASTISLIFNAYSTYHKGNACLVLVILGSKIIDLLYYIDFWRFMYMRDIYHKCKSIFQIL